MPTLPPLVGEGTATTRVQTPSNPQQSKGKRPLTTHQRSLKGSVGNSRELFECLQHSRQVESDLREQVQKLSTEVKTLRCRLDGLRKAKTQTQIKRETVDAVEYRQLPCKCHHRIQELEKKLHTKEEAWTRREREWKVSHEADLERARREALLRARPKSSTEELLEASQAEVARLREVVSHLQAKARCRQRSAKSPTIDVSADVFRRLEELASEVKNKELEFSQREKKLQASQEARCKSNHELWMKEAQINLQSLVEENLYLRRRLEELHKKLKSSLDLV